MGWTSEPDYVLPAPSKAGDTVVIVNATDQPVIIGLPVNDVKLTEADLATGQAFILTTNIDGIIKQEAIPLEKVYLNKVPTHDPYTNPDSHIYYQCNCGAILDPGTRSFAALNNAAMNAGWKVRWGAEYYQPYCVECGKDVE